ncbi:hypothetical protein CLV98_102470 [Dyadobacter jejuensis]|uniref:Uncharacterized protein n=1 Tax=Dyadobacter jejuensis TaxID=1082580 RepID=A0A316AQE6_9BACT|nr:hypothetical protein [Dyadobacter jejuensis]PWJ59636.1 hypothetical protein CLV98_102470 [Dyadobacter jejuensis]
MKTQKFGRISVILLPLTQYLFIPILLVLLPSCEKSLDRVAVTEPDGSSSARLSQEALVSISYEVESFSVRQLAKQTRALNDKGLSDFAEIGAQPHLDRTSIDLQIFKDGSYRMTTVRLEPTRKHLLPESLNKKYERYKAGPYKTVSNNGSLTFYDEEGNEIGRHQLKSNPYTDLVRQIKAAKPNEINKIANGVMGNPLINEVEINQVASEKKAKIQRQGNITRFEFEHQDESDKAVPNKLITQVYDFKANRLLETSMFAKDSKKLLMRSVLFYDQVDKGNRVNRTLNESYSTDLVSGVETRHYREDFYSNMEVVVNR